MVRGTGGGPLGAAADGVGEVTSIAARPGDPPAGTDRHVSRMARSGGLSLMGAGVSTVVGVLLTVVVTRSMSQADAGRFFAATSLFLIALGVAQLGTDVGLVRWLPRLRVRGEVADLPRTLRFALLPALGVSVLVAAAGVAGAPWVAGLLSAGDPPGHFVTGVRVLAVALPLAVLSSIMLTTTRGLGTMAPTVLIESVGRTSTQLLLVAAVGVLGLAPRWAIVSWAVAFGLSAAAATATALPRLRRAARADGAAPAGVIRARDFWAFTSPRAVGTAVQAALKRSDIVLVAALRSPEEAALYAAATRFVVVGQLGVQALQQALSPQLSALFAQEDHDGVRSVYRATTSWAMLLGWPIYLSAAALAPTLLLIFGPGYTDVADVVVLLSLTMLVATGCGAVDSMLLMSGHPWLSLGNNVIALVLNVGLNLVLIPAWGVWGAGVSWAVAIVTRNLLPLFQVRRHFAINPFSRESLLVAGSSLLCFGVGPLIVRLAGGEIVPAVLTLLAGAVVYLLLLWRLREPLHLDAFRTSVRRRRGAGR